MKNFSKNTFVAMLLFLFSFGYSQGARQIETAQLQFIHNSPDNSLKTVDIYINGVLQLNDFNFRTASTFFSVPTNIPTRIDIASGNSSTAANKSVYSITTSLTGLASYIVVLDGMLTVDQYFPNRPLKLTVYNKARITSSDPGNIDLLFFHGAPDSPIVNIEEISAPLGKIIGNISYGMFNQNYLELSNIDYKIKVNTLPAVDNAFAEIPEDLGSYYLPLQTMGLTMEAVTLLTSGFVHPELNNNGPSFGVYLALPSGSNLIPLDRIALDVNNFSTLNIRMYPNPVSSVLKLDIPINYKNATAKVIDTSGNEVLNINNLTNEINVSNLRNGLYLINLNIDNINYVQKFIVNR